MCSVVKAMSTVTFPEIGNISTELRSQPKLEAVSPLLPSPLGMIPDLGVDVPTVPVPNVLSNEQYQAIPAWTYKKFQLTDLFYSKVGISAATSLSAFSILSVINPPFVQERSDNPIEINKPSFTVLYCISLVVFLFMMVVPVA